MSIFSLLSIAFLILICIGYSVGMAAGFISTLGAAELFGGIFNPRTGSMLARSLLDKMDSFLLLAIPFFLLAGRLMNTTGVTTRLFNFIALLVQPLKGGLGHANVLSSVAFAGMSGSATADAVGLGTIEMKAMLEKGYDREFSAGVTAASSLLGPVIPPSIVLVAYGVQAEVSVGKMFLAGVVPGLLLAAAYMAYVWYLAHRDNHPDGSWPSRAEVIGSARYAVLPMLMPLIIIVGIYSGAFTPTEAAAAACAYAIVLGFIYRELSLRQLFNEIKCTMIDTAVIMLIIATTSMFGQLMVLEGMPDRLATTFASITTNPIGMMFIFMVLWTIVGFFMAQTPAVLILTPILLPIATQVGIDPIHLGVVMSITLTIGLLTPPVGMVLYALVRVTELSFGRLAVLSMPYVILSTLVVVLLILFPQLVLFLPNLM